MMAPEHHRSMSEEQLRAFQKVVKADAALQEKVSAAGDADAVVAIAKAAGYVITAEELIDAQADLLEDKLEGVIGGANQFSTTTKLNGDCGDPAGLICGCGEENCACVSCDSAAADT